jgi:hypothetical protein
MLMRRFSLAIATLIAIPGAATFAVAGPVAAQPVTVQVVTPGDPDQAPPDANILTVRQPRRPSPEPTFTRPGTATPETVTIVVRDPAPPVVVERIHHIEVQTVEEPTPDELPTLASWLEGALWFDAVDLGELELVFEDPEIANVEGRWLDADVAGLRRSLTGGVSIGSSLEINEWIRFPQFRFYLGGGNLDAPWVPIDGEASQVHARASSVVVVRGELSGGLFHRFGPLTPYAIGRIAYAGYFLSVDIQHDGLGALGEELIADGAWEAGIEAGVGLQLDDELRVTAAYRRSFTGAESHGFLLGLSLGVGP